MFSNLALEPGEIKTTATMIKKKKKKKLKRYSEAK